jgi:hypothetical protein
LPKRRNPDEPDPFVIGQAEHQRFAKPMDERRRATTARKEGGVGRDRGALQKLWRRGGLSGNVAGIDERIGDDRQAG